jgi:AcrR family transcriptional regulator
MAPDKPNHSDPPGKIKIAEALKLLLREKDFNSITTADISRTSGVNEALIYRYYKDKRGLLHDVLAEYLEDYVEKMAFEMKGIKGATNKLRKLIWATIYLYHQDRVFAKILLLEVRNFRGYFESY